MIRRLFVMSAVIVASLLTEVARLTDMLSCMQRMFSETIKSSNTINIK